MSLASGAETLVEEPKLSVDGRPREALDVEAAVHADYYEGQHAFSMRLLGEVTQYGGWSDVAWEAPPPQWSDSKKS